MLNGLSCLFDSVGGEFVWKERRRRPLERLCGAVPCGCGP